MPTLLGEIRDCRVTGPLDIHSDWSDKWLNFVNVTFDEPVDFSGTKARGIGLYGCRFRKGANLSGITLSGSLIAYKTAFHADSRTRQPGLRLDAARLGEELKVLACSVEGGIFAENTRITGNADFRGVHVYAKGGAPQATELQNLANKDEFRRTFGEQYPHLPLAFRLVGSRVEGSLLLSALYDEPIKGLSQSMRFPRIAFLGGDVELANVEISGDLDLQGLVATRRLSLQNSIIKGNINAECELHAGRVVRFVAGGFVDLYGVQVGGNLQLPSAYLARGLHIRFGRIGGYLFARQRFTEGDQMPPLEIGVDHENVSLDLSGSHIGGVECEGAKMDGQVRAATGEFGRFYLTPFATNPGSTAMRFSPCEAAGVFMRSVSIAENARFDGIRLNEYVSEHPITEKGYAGLFQMINCSVGGDLGIGSDGLCRHLWPGLPEETKELSIRPDVRTIFGFASRPNKGRQQAEPREEWWKTDARNAAVLRQLNLSGTKVDRDLNMSCLVAKNDIVLDHVTVKGDLRMSRISGLYGPPVVVKEFRTQCRNVLAAGLRCEGDADMTGIDAEESVRARHIEVRGNLLLADEDSSDACADIAGDVDLQGASASSCVFSARNFRHPRGTMTLSDTEFRKVSIKGAGALPTRTEMLKFHNANISRWEIEEEKPAFHRKTEPVEGGAYVSIEKYFREEGLFHEANRVLIDRVRRSTRMSVAKEWSRPRTVLGWTLPAPIRWLCALVTVAFEGIVWLVGEFVGHGTRPWPSLVAIIVVFLWSTSTFLDPINVDAAPALRARLVAVEPGEIHPGDGRCPGYCSNQPDCLDICSNWGVRNAVTLAARYNVPLAGATVDDIWRPSLRVSQAARLISFSNWIFWPLFLGTLARYVLRRL